MQAPALVCMVQIQRGTWEAGRNDWQQSYPGGHVPKAERCSPSRHLPLPHHAVLLSGAAASNLPPPRRDTKGPHRKSSRAGTAPRIGIGATSASLEALWPCLETFPLSRLGREGPPGAPNGSRPAMTYGTAPQRRATQPRTSAARGRAAQPLSTVQTKQPAFGRAFLMD